MVDEKLEDQVWVTVVATGYGYAARPGAPAQLREPAGEPRIKRTAGQRERERDTRESRRGGLVVSDRDVPEFIPNF